ncbi:hypothetical protein Agabi119p4_8354 [Agaricus bisporus var. burnettii]|uniref:Uncharacterized protein n=1 Tax=Agaricus bisporus var. burnettii TaxID=192524 RepID=A0A8H7C6L1_AGABI|nr:hypothetical protein Agabi119p4_8354 [Agaricus bisporus var. burnettii]
MSRLPLIAPAQTELPSTTLSYSDESQATAILTRAKSKARQTNNSQSTGLVPVNENPEQILFPRGKPKARGQVPPALSIDTNATTLSNIASTSKTVRFREPVVCSPTDTESNPFYVPTAPSDDSLNLELPGQFRLPDTTVYHSVPNSL